MRATVDRDAGSSIALSGIFYAIAAQLERIQTLETSSQPRYHYQNFYLCGAPVGAA